MHELSAGPESAGEWDLRALCTTWWGRRWWLLTSVVVFTAAFAAAAFLMTPVYRAAIVVAPANFDRNGLGGLGSVLGQFGGLASLAGISLGSDNSALEESLAVLRSREFTERYIRDRQLAPELFPARWDRARGGWKGGPKNAVTLARAYRYFDKHVRSISHDKKTGLVTLRIEWKDPVRAAQWANELIAQLNAEMRARAIKHTTASLDYLQKESLATTLIATREAISRLMETQINQRMLANVTQEYAFRVIDRAMAPDLTDPVRPKKVVLLVLGVLLGIFVGAMAALVVPQRKRTRHPGSR